MSKAIQLLNITPEELKTAILEGVKVQIEDLKKNFEPKHPTVYLTRNQVAEMLHVDLSTIHNYTKKGKLIAYSIEHRVYYKREEVENALIELKK